MLFACHRSRKPSESVKDLPLDEAITSRQAPDFNADLYLDFIQKILNETVRA